MIDTSGPRQIGEPPPIADPTPLTTAQLLREIALLRELLETQSKLFRELIETRLDGMDRALEVTNKFPTQLDTATKMLKSLIADNSDHLGELFDEKLKGVAIQFDSIQKQFEERDTRAKQEKDSQSKAIDAAFAAQKEAAGEQNRSNTLAIGKSEERVDQRIAGLEALQGQMAKGMGDRMDGLKDLINTNTLNISAISNHSKGGSDVWGYIALGFSILAGLGVLASFLREPAPATTPAPVPNVIYLQPAPMPPQTPMISAPK